VDNKDLGKRKVVLEREQELRRQQEQQSTTPVPCASPKQVKSNTTTTYHEAQRRVWIISRMASDKEMKRVLQKVELVATSLEFGNSNANSTSGGMDIDPGRDKDNTSDTGDSRNNEFRPHQ
jgi:hypothetical protein